MKILAIGDFHGKIPIKLRRQIKRADIDLIFCTGDYRPFRLKKIFFKKYFKTNKKLWNGIGKKEFKKSYLADWEDAEKIFKWPNSLRIPVITTVGNYDVNFNDTVDGVKKDEWKWAKQDFFGNILKKYPNIKRTDYRAVKIGNIVVIGGFGHSSPGMIQSRAYRKSRKKLDKLFKKYSKENEEKRVIFIFHNMPYNCKLDKIMDKNADKSIYGKHYGNKLTRRMINRYQPILGIGGHMHGNQGKCKIESSLIINTGAAKDGQCAIIDFDEKKRKVKSVEFVR